MTVEELYAYISDPQTIGARTLAWARVCALAESGCAGAFCTPAWRDALVLACTSECGPACVSVARILECVIEVSCVYAHMFCTYAVRDAVVALAHTTTDDAGVCAAAGALRELHWGRSSCGAVVPSESVRDALLELARRASNDDARAAVARALTAVAVTDAGEELLGTESVRDALVYLGTCVPSTKSREWVCSAITNITSRRTAAYCQLYRTTAVCAMLVDIFEGAGGDRGVVRWAAAALSNVLAVPCTECVDANATRRITAALAAIGDAVLDGRTAEAVGRLIARMVRVQATPVEFNFAGVCAALVSALCNPVSGDDTHLLRVLACLSAAYAEPMREYLGTQMVYHALLLAARRAREDAKEYRRAAIAGILADVLVHCTGSGHRVASVCEALFVLTYAGGAKTVRHTTRAFHVLLAEPRGQAQMCTAFARDELVRCATAARDEPTRLCVADVIGRACTCDRGFDLYHCGTINCAVVDMAQETTSDDTRSMLADTMMCLARGRVPGYPSGGAAALFASAIAMLVDVTNHDARYAVLRALEAMSADGVVVENDDANRGARNALATARMSSDARACKLIDCLEAQLTNDKPDDDDDDDVSDNCARWLESADRAGFRTAAFFTCYACYATHLRAVTLACARNDAYASWFACHANADRCPAALCRRCYLKLANTSARCLCGSREHAQPAMRLARFHLALPVLCPHGCGACVPLGDAAAHTAQCSAVCAHASKRHSPDAGV